MADVLREQVGKSYDNGIAALRDIALHIEDAELLTVVGTSRSGTTTLLRLFAGFGDTDAEEHSHRRTSH